MRFLRHEFYFRKILAVVLAFGLGWKGFANPAGLSVASGTAIAQQIGRQLTITASQNAFLNWQTFNIAAGETTIFNQPSAASVVWNRINDPNVSQIYGNLQANGVVVLMNPSGFYFGPNSFVNAAGLVVSTAQVAPPENSGGAWEFNGPPPLASIVNYGRINVGQNGSAFLIADNVQNFGSLNAPGGSIGLASGQTVLLSERPDGRGMSMSVTLPTGSVNNYGTITADGGTIAMNAQVVNQNGLIQANSVRNENGVIELVAADALNLGANSKMIASGDDSANGSAGGGVTLKSENSFSDSSGSEIITTGGARGGDGGNVEISAPNILSLNSSIDASAQPGWSGGVFALDPVDIVLGNSGSTTPDGTGTVDGSGAGPDTFYVNVNTAFQNISAGQILLEASGNITLNANLFWDLSSTTPTGSGQLTLAAGGNIIFGNNAQIYDEGSWSVNLFAGVNNFTTDAVTPGTGSIFLGGVAADQITPLDYYGNIQTTAGSISLTAGQDIQIGSGSVSTLGGGGINLVANGNILIKDGSVVTFGGGDINATAATGSVNTGNGAYGYDFNEVNTPGGAFYSVDSSLGGISTAAGGNVSITAAQNIASLLPTAQNGITTDAGSGAFGGGNVTLVAGGNVTGHYVVAGGAGVICAGAELDASGNPVLDAGGNFILNAASTGSAGTVASELALSLINGSWNVQAADSIVLQEVRNPNGIYNNAKTSNGDSPISLHYFDFAPGDSVTLDAGNSVTLDGSNVPRNPGDIIGGSPIPSVYAPILNITAGAGGVTLGSKIILFPSPLGSLDITTTGGGSLTAGSLTELILSDSGSSQFLNATTFGDNDHAATPVHFSSPTVCALNISGDMDNVELVAPEAAQINVGGDLINSRFLGQNLHPNDVTSINVGGDIMNLNVYSQISLAALPDFSVLNQAYIGGQVTPLTDLASRLYYDPTTGKLTYRGVMSQSYLSALESLTYQVFDANGQPEFDLQGNPVLQNVQLLDPQTAQALYAESQNAASNYAQSGYVIGGGGQFNLTAHNLDLGATTGIQSVGPQLNLGLVGAPAYLSSGADINVTLTGDLDMFSTAIFSLGGGSIFVNAPNGEVDVGSGVLPSPPNGELGIFSVEKADVTVIAGDDLNLNGSRIAAFNGGNVTVESLNGNINVGAGGGGSVVVDEIYVNPTTHQIIQDSPPTTDIGGSGILAFTYPWQNADPSVPATQYLLGNVLVEAPNGNVSCTQAGIIQRSFNGTQNSDATVEILSGYQLQDAGGNPVYAANLASGSPVQISAARDIDVSGSGVVAQNAVLKSSGNITGVVFANNVDLNAQQNVNATVLASGQANVSGGGSVSGTIIGVSGANVSGGGGIDATVLSQNGNVNGQSGGNTFAQGTAANATSTAASASDDSKKTAEKTDDQSDDDPKKKKGIALAQKVSRVTVLLPKRN